MKSPPQNHAFRNNPENFHHAYLKFLHTKSESLASTPPNETPRDWSSDSE